MFSVLLSRLVILFLGILYPAYASYKAISSKSPKDYVKWMMYWVVFSLFLAAETFTDIFLAFWFPFYYEIKIIIVLWLMMPATRGSSILYRKFVHPLLKTHEKDVDEYIERAKTDGYSVFKEFSRIALQHLATFVVQGTAALQTMANRTVSNPKIVTVPALKTAPHENNPIIKLEPRDDDDEVVILEAEVNAPVGTRTRNRRNKRVDSD